METVPTFTTSYLILFVVSLIVLIIAISTYMQRWAVVNLVKVFRKKNALNATNAIKHEELGIQQQIFFLRRPDYRPQTLQHFIKMQVVKETEDGRLYFSEKKYAAINREDSLVAKILFPK